MADSKFSDIIESSLEKIKEFTGTETVIGEPVMVGDTTVIPVSRITMGFASGGIDYAAKKAGKEAPSKNPNNFGGGGGTGVNITPIAFLVISPTGGAEVLPITGYNDSTSVDKITGLIERSPEILSRLKDVFAKKKKDAAEPAEEPNGEANAEENA